MSWVSKGVFSLSSLNCHAFLERIVEWFPVANQPFSLGICPICCGEKRWIHAFPKGIHVKISATDLARIWTLLANSTPVPITGMLWAHSKKMNYRNLSFQIWQRSLRQDVKIITSRKRYYNSQVCKIHLEYFHQIRF